VLLVTAGVALDWQIPRDRPLPKAIAEIGGQLREHYRAFRFNPKVRAQHPEVANAASYALYAFFGYDREKVRLWEQTYQELFGPHTLRVAATPAPNATPRPFMARPFRQPPAPTPFYTLNSFLDHDAPYAYDEGTLTRFDGRVLQGDRSECDLGKSCYSGHEGLDYDTGREYPAIKPPVYAVADGVVSRVREECGQVEILHEARQVVSVYMHMEDIQVTRGQTVTQGALLGYTGNVAINEPGECSSSGAHLHFHVRFQHALRAFIEPFGWWGESSDPLETYMPDGWSGSWWLWQGDEAGDGSLVVDDRESQAQLFHPVYDRESGQTWWHDPNGYNGGAWWTYSVTDTAQSTNWGIWGTYLSRGRYCVQAYWPAHPENASRAIYRLFREGSGLLAEVAIHPPTSHNAWIPLGDYLFEEGPAVVILTDFVGPDGPKGRRVYFDAVRWQPGPCATPTPTPSPTPTPTPLSPVTVRISITTGLEDAGPEPSTCRYSTSWNEIYFGECANGARITSGFRFGNVPVPRDVRIIEAYLEFTVDGPYDAPVGVHIFGQASGDAQPFGDADRPENRPRTSSFVPWNIPAADHWELGMIRRTPNLARVVQEIVSRPDWRPYQGMAFILETVAAAPGQHRRVIGFERPVWYPGSAHAARLVIRYTGAPLPPRPTPTSTPQPCPVRWMQAQGLDLPDLSLLEAARARLSQTPAGRRYVALYYAHGPALIRLLQQDPEARQALAEALRQWQPLLQAWVEGRDAQVSPDQAAALQRAARLLIERGEPSLRAAAEQEARRIPWARLAGMRLRELEGLLLEPSSATGTPEPPRPTGTPQP
jgi:murein DD-endopeptidase MepM/ murein hydrolase activator NlpD